MRVLVVIAALASVSHARRVQATSDEQSNLFQTQIQTVMEDPIAQKLMGHLVGPLHAMRAETEQIQTVLSDPSFQIEAKRVIEPVTALMASPEFQKQVQRILKQLQTLAVDPAFRRQLERIAKPLLGVTAKPGLREMELILHQVQVLMADPNFQKQAERAIEPFVEMMSSENVAEELKITIEQLKAVMADKKFQLQAKRISEPVTALVAEAKRLEAKIMAEQLETLGESPASPQKSLASVLLASSPASVGKARLKTLQYGRDGRIPSQRRLLMVDSKEAKPSTKALGKAFEGVWAKGTIANGKMYFRGEFQGDIRFIDDKNFAMIVEGKRYTAELKSDGKMYWSDGDVWSRQERETPEEVPLNSAENFWWLGITAVGFGMMAPFLWNLQNV
mmetsp:Transcript_65504/g.103746  ORF Transcript_65504/g.103746 Transcript_65504/m.103746 type:complete len:391 (-) Transcript_65504:27-1199(-)